ncbi:hypothetical protein Tco_0598044, partial [Tanacetum coccineum]
VELGLVVVMYHSEDNDENLVRVTLVPTPPHDSPLPRVNILGSDEGSMSLQELMVLCKKLEKTIKTSQVRRRAKIVVLDDEEDLEDYSKQGRMIEEMDQDARVTLVTPTIEVAKRSGGHGHRAKRATG